MKIGRQLRPSELYRPSPCLHLLPVVEGPSQGKSAPGLVEFVRAHADELRAELFERGALLLRGFGDTAPSTFGEASRALLGELGEYPFFTGNYRKRLAPGVVESSSVASHLPVIPHTEQSFNRLRPRTLGFACLEPASAGGHTTLHDMAAIHAELPMWMARLLAQSSIGKRTLPLDATGRRNLFGDVSLAEVRAICERFGAECAIDGERVAISTQGPCVTRHPESGLDCFSAFSTTLDSVYDFFSDDELGTYPGASATVRRCAELMPFAMFTRILKLSSVHFRRENLYFFEREGREVDLGRVLHRATNELIWKHSLLWNWQRGDVLFIDNIRVGHSRMPYLGQQRRLAAVIGPLYDALDQVYRPGLRAGQAA